MAVRITGTLNEDALVYDFVELKRTVANLVSRLDHRMLIQTKNALLTVVAEENEVRVRHREATYVFPREDVVLLPIENIQRARVVPVFE